jgi:hypothetical protein
MHPLPEERPLLRGRLASEGMQRWVDGDDLDSNKDEDRDGDDRRHRHQEPATERA